MGKGGKIPKKVKADEADVLDAMITSLLEEGGVITQEEWGQRIQKNLKS